MKKMLDGTIILSFEERRNLDKCPNCNSKEFIMKIIPIKNPEVRQLLTTRVVIQCKKCGYWTDWFDGYTWHPPK